MSDTSLNFAITVKGDEATLRDIYGRLTHPDTGCSDLANVLAVMVQQTLIASGVTNDFDVTFHCGQVQKAYQRGGGLNPNEWLEGGGKS